MRIFWGMDNRFGLTGDQVRLARERHGENRFTRQKQRGFWRQFFAGFSDPLIVILLVALLLNTALVFQSGDFAESLGIAAAVFVAVFVSTLSEYQSSRAFEKLRENAEDRRCRVRRGGAVIEIAAGELVVGDVVLLTGGDAVPADGTVVFGELLVNQSAVNGESKEARKHPAAADGTPSPEQRQALFCGSLVTGGDAEMQVDAVGDATLYGSIAAGVQGAARKSPLFEKLARLAKLLSRIGFCAAALVGAADFLYAVFAAGGGNLAAGFALLSADGALFFSHILHALTLAVTLVVVAVPEGLPMMITVVLSAQMRRMLREGVLVRKLVGIETAGTMDLLFCDKTGTLTQGAHSVTGFFFADGSFAAAQDMPHHPLAEDVALSCRYNNQALLADGKACGANATDRALLTYSLPFSVPERRIAERICFESAEKYAAVRLSDGGLCLYKGAPEKLLSLCAQAVLPRAGIQALDAPQKARLLAKVQSAQRGGARVLALCTARGGLHAALREKRLSLLCFALLSDRLREESADTVARLQGAGVQVVMLTGDSAETAQAAARQAGILRGAQDLCLSGEELGALSDEALLEQLPRLRTVFRCKPADKQRLARLASAAGRVTGMTGDGVNDAPALKCADVGFAMGSGTQIAKDAADIVLTDSRLHTIGNAVLYGRTVFRSICKFITFQLTMNFCAMLISFLGPLFGVETPITMLQMLWVNLIMDTLASLAFAGEAARESYLSEAPLPRSAPILSRGMRAQIVCATGFCVALCCLFLASNRLRALFGYAENETPFLCAFFVLFVFLGVFNAFNVRTPRLKLQAQLARNPAFLAVMALVSAVQIALVYCGGALFRAAPLSLPALGFVLCLAALILPADLLRKSLIKSIKKHPSKHAF